MARPEPRLPSTDELVDNLNRDAKGPGWSLLTWLADARYLTNDQIARRFYRTLQGVRTATYRMARLAEWGLIASRQLRGRRRVWYLSEAGARLVAGYLGTTVTRLGYDDAAGRIQQAYVFHRLAVTDLELAVRAHAAQRRGNLLQFVREPTVPTTAGELRPDAAFTYAERGRTWHYALEIDRNTERPARFALTKVPRYDALARTDDWRLFWDELPTCLVVVTEGGEERVRRLKAEIDRLPIVGGDYRLFKFTTAEALYRLPPSERGALPEAITRFSEPVCLAARKPESERRAVFG